MISTNNRIINEATKLFNEKGYKNVSLRNIAEAAGTTIGNLTYHFPKKEDLVSTIQLELYMDFLNINFDMEDGELLFKEMLDSFIIMDRNRDNNIFFYRNIVELCHESERIAENVKDFRYKIYAFYLTCFKKLQEDELMRSDISEEQFGILTYTMSNIIYIWRQDKTQYYDNNIPRIELNIALKNLIYPYLSEKGINLYSDLGKVT